jgi:hypothetical protein
MYKRNGILVILSDRDFSPRLGSSSAKIARLELWLNQIALDVMADKNADFLLEEEP